MKLSFKKRIALLNSMAVAIIMAIVFMVIYGVVFYSSYKHLDEDISMEKEEIFNNLDWKEDRIIMNKMPEWEEGERRQLEVNPTFIQIVDIDGTTIFKSANLQRDHFLFNPHIKEPTFYNSTINEQRIRQGQFPVFNENDKIIGQLTIGISQQESYNVLYNLLFVLILTYIFTLTILYVIMSLVASKAIEPVNRLIKSTADINDSNLNSRLPLPENQDEIHQLATTINDLINRLESSIHQQKQFTADASHEMRTPLAAIKGTLEVLLRNKRTPEQYESKIKDVIAQTDRLAFLFEELLQLARLESNMVIAKKTKLDLKTAIKKIVFNYQTIARANNNSIHIDIPENSIVNADEVLLERVLNNIIFNAIKYNRPNGNIFCSWDSITHSLTIKDEGIGIASTQLPFLFDRFYRADNSRSSYVPGNGIGLSIVKKLCNLQLINITVESTEGVGTSFILHFSTVNI